MQDVTFMVEKLSPNDAAIIYNTFKFVNDLLNPEMYGHAVSAEVRDQKPGLFRFTESRTECLPISFITKIQAKFGKNLWGYLQQMIC